MMFRKSFLYLFLIIVLTSGLAAQFGKNKVQYRDFDWKYIQSKHFNVYYYDSKELAVSTAIMAERALQSIQEILQFSLKKRVSIMVYNSHNEFQQTNVIDIFMSEGVGGVTELKKNRVVLPFQGNYAQYDHVIHHELVHAMINEMFYGGTLQTAVSTGMKIQYPIWMSEGLAEFESIGGMDAQTDMFMRDLALNEQLIDLKYLSGYYAYRVGQAFYWYVARTYGEEKITDLINRVRIYGSLENTFEATFNMSIDEFSDAWKKEMQKYYWPDINVFEEPDDYAKRLTDHEKLGNFYNTSPAISPDGSKMAYIADEAGTFGIFIKKTEAKAEPRRIISSNRMQEFEDLNLLTPGISWSPDGKKLLVSAKAGAADAVFVIDTETEDYEKLPIDLSSISSVTWAPDGNSLLFVGSEHDRSDIYIYNFDTEDIQNLTNDIFTDMVPVWSNDSKRFFFVSDRGDYINKAVQDFNVKMWNYDVYRSDVYSYDLETGKIERLTFDPDFLETSVAVSPDNSKILYVSDKNGIGNIYELDLNTKIAKPKTNSLNGILQISLSNDGTKLLFSTLNNGGYDIFEFEFPFEKTIPGDTIPSTRYRSEYLETRALIDGIAENISDSNEVKTYKGYGKFEVEFTRQQLVKPNLDARDQEMSEYIDGMGSEYLSDTSFVEKDYKLSFSPDFVMGNPGFSTYFGFQGIAQVLFSDVMGDHQIFFQANLLLDLRNSYFFLAYLYLPKIIDYQARAYHSSAFVIRSDRNLYRFRDWGMAGYASYPFDRYNRLEGGLSFKVLSRENIDNPHQKAVSRALLVPELRYVHDDVIWGWYGPVKGSRYYLKMLTTPGLFNDEVSFFTLSGDYRHYIMLSETMSLAFRATAAKSIGQREQRFFLGGTENWINREFSNNYLPFDEPEDFAFQEFIMPMRGTAVNERNGSQFFLINAEYRFPLIRALLAGPLPILLQSIYGSIFWDMGAAWYGDLSDFRSVIRKPNGNVVPYDLLMSSGIGIRTNLLGMPFKIDIAWEYLYWNWSKPMYLISLGYDF